MAEAFGGGGSGAAMSNDSVEEEGAGRRTRSIIIAAAAVLAFAVVAGIWIVFAFVEGERERDLQQWQIRLSIVADSRAREVSRWLDDQFLTMASLAENASLQLYMTELTLGEGEDARAELGYLRNLLDATAARDGFLPAQPEPTVNANIEPTGQAGIALADAEGNLIAASQATPPFTARIRRAMNQAAEGAPALIDIFEGAGGAPTIGFVVPVYGVQADVGGSDGIGFVIGVRLVDEELFDRLKQPGETAASAESYLVRKVEATVEYLSPLADGTGPLKRRLALDTAQLAAGFVMAKPGGFAARRDYKTTEVLVTGRSIAEAPWFLVRKIDLAEALAETDQRLTTLLTVFILVIVGVTVAIIAVWRHGTSVRAAQAARRFRIANERLENFSHFLRVVSDGQPTAVSAVTREGRYFFANEKAAEGTGITHDEMLDKTMGSVIGPIRAKVYQEINEEVLNSSESMNRVHQFEFEDGTTRTVMSDHIKLNADRDHPEGVLMIVQDLTDVVRERERRERTMRALVGTLVSLVDRRDPYSADQSQRVAEVSAAVADEMGEPDDTRRTVDIAGNLMNLGKILVPPEILTKTGALSEEEAEQVRQSLLGTADMVEAVDFDLPIAPTLRHLQERWDGGGYPDGIDGEAIEIGARLIAVANAFVGMVSPRAWRDALGFDAAAAQLMAESGRRFDPRPVAALINVINNRGGRETWAHFSQAPEGEGEDG